MKDRIKIFRKSLNLTQQNVADLLGVKRNTVAQWEIGINSVSEQTIKAICREFNVSETWLRTGEGEMFKPNPNDALSKFIQERGLSPDDQALIEKFAALDAASRQAFVAYVLSTADAIMSLESPKPSAAPQNQLPELVGKPAEPELAAVIPEGSTPEIEAQVARIREQLIIEASIRTSGASTPAKAG